MSRSGYGNSPAVLVSSSSANSDSSMSSGLSSLPCTFCARFRQACTMSLRPL
uniref:Uncharacterized protein n=1 Tax=Arundo donax TaxID=35708 RepID=A0A0A9G2U2_ARUDO